MRQKIVRVIGKIFAMALLVTAATSFSSNVQATVWAAGDTILIDAAMPYPLDCVKTTDIGGTYSGVFNTKYSYICDEPTNGAGTDLTPREVMPLCPKDLISAPNFIYENTSSSSGKTHLWSLVNVQDAAGNRILLNGDYYSALSSYGTTTVKGARAVTICITP